MPPAMGPREVLLELEQQDNRTFVLSSGTEPAAGVVRFDGSIFGAVGVVGPHDDGTGTIDVSGDIWVKDSTRGWRSVCGFGMGSGGPLPGDEPYVICSGGCSVQTDAGDEWFVLGVCGHLSASGAATVIVNGSVVAHLASTDDRRFFCVPVAVPPFGNGDEPIVALRREV